MDTISGGGEPKPAPRYRPRDFCAEPESFGYAWTVRWIRPTDERSRALTEAAHLQHYYAVRIRTRAKLLDAQMKGAVKAAAKEAGSDATTETSVTSEKSLKRLASKMGTSYPRLLRALRGEVVLRLDDIAWADLVLGEISELARARTANEQLGQRSRPATRGGSR
jgi:hypothetical protein